MAMATMMKLSSAEWQHNNDEVVIGQGMVMAMSTMMSHHRPDDGTMMSTMMHDNGDIWIPTLLERERENIIRDDQGNDMKVEMGGGRYYEDENNTVILIFGRIEK